MVRMTIIDYLDRLRGEEAYKPKAEQRPIPALQELAEALDCSTTTMSRIAHLNSVDTRYRRQISLEQIDKLVKFFHGRGFPVQVADLMVYEPD